MDERMKDEKESRNRDLAYALARVLDELNLPYKTNRMKYLLVKMNGSWTSLP